jgi:ribosomal protein L1
VGGKIPQLPQEEFIMKHGKKYVEAAKAIDRATLYDPAEAIALAKKAAIAKTTSKNKI